MRSAGTQQETKWEPVHQMDQSACWICGSDAANRKPWTDSECVHSQIDGWTDQLINSQTDQTTNQPSVVSLSGCAPPTAVGPSLRPCSALTTDRKPGIGIGPASFLSCSPLELHTPGDGQHHARFELTPRTVNHTYTYRG